MTKFKFSKSWLVRHYNFQSAKLQSVDRSTLTKFFVPLKPLLHCPNYSMRSLSSSTYHLGCSSSSLGLINNSTGWLATASTPSIGSFAFTNFRSEQVATWLTSVHIDNTSVLRRRYFASWRDETNFNVLIRCLAISCLWRAKLPRVQISGRLGTS